LLVVAIAGCLAFGRWVGDRRQGRALLLANVILFLPGLAVIMTAETRPNPTLPATVDQTASDAHDGGSLEGKEVRFGSGASALFAAATTATSTGSVDAMHDSLSPLGGLVTLWMIQLGEVVFDLQCSAFCGALEFAQDGFKRLLLLLQSRQHLGASL
jgi:K+-transporting ATPase ATPase A chain